jgi:hypothetical protein
MGAMRTRTESLLVVVALLGAGTAPARAQDEGVDPRWLAYVGCWEPNEAALSRLCVVPASGTSAVDFVTVVNGQIAARERIAVTGERLETRRADCASWRSAVWSSHGQRVYLRSGDDCGDGRDGTGLIAMSGAGQWLYIQSATVAGQTGVRVQRYRDAARDIPLPAELADAWRLGISATSEARAAAGAPLSIDDVVEASRSVERAVLEAWLIERAEPFTLDATRVVALADAGVPTPVIDLMVALSYPKVFAINTAARRGERRVAPADSSRRSILTATAPIDPFCFSSNFRYSHSLFDCAGLGGLGYRYGYPYGFGYEYGGWYPGGYPVTIVYVGSPGAPARPHGRVVNGRGYRLGGGEGTPATPRGFEPRSSGSTRSSAGASGTGYTQGSSTSSTSSSTSGEQRTAKPRPRD